MGWSDGSQTRFAVACAEASEILAGLSSRDAADVILAGAAPRAVFPAMGGNIGYLQGEIRRARLTSEALDPEAALRLAVRLLNGQEGRKEICVVSDFQASNWRGVQPRLPPDIGLTCVSIARGEAPNAAILSVVAEPARSLLIPGFPGVKAAAREAGALGCSISGSGPSVATPSRPPACGPAPVPWPPGRRPAPSGWFRAPGGSSMCRRRP